MSPRIAALPIDDVLSHVVAGLRDSAYLVLQAPPGAGKTTRVPPALLDAGFAEAGKIIVLQPRRVAARATAARIAAERGTRLGDEIGYRVRFDSRAGPKTQIEIVTEGILLRRLLDDPFLPGVAMVVFDEFHERSLTSDLALGMVRQIQQSVRPELRIFVMSATLAAEPVAAYLGDCPIVKSQGRLFPVDIRHVPHLERRDVVDSVADGVAQALSLTGGDLLVFLPGVGEIRRCESRLATLAQQHNLAIMPLYGDLPAEQQDAVLARSDRRKLILSTNVAETSLTIEGVTGVIDSGLARVLRYDDATGLDKLELTPISKASADQRAGRAGRTQAGICLRLWPQVGHRHRPEFELPEIQRVDLAGALLQLLCWIEPDPAAFPWFEPPPSAALERAQSLLEQLGSSHGGTITPLGRRMAALPIHPRLGRLLLEGQSRAIAPQAALAAALLSERDPFLRDARPRHQRGPAVHSRSDLLDRVHAVEAYETSGQLESDVGTLHRSAAQSILRTRDQLLRLLSQFLHSQQRQTSTDDSSFLQAVFAAYPDRLTRRREPGSRRGVMVGGRGVRLDESVALADEELYVCIDVDAAAGEAVVRQASAVDRDWLPAEQLRTETVVAFDEPTGKVLARKRLLYETLVLEDMQAAPPSPEEVATALADAAATRLNLVFPADNPAAGGFRTRVNSLADWMPDLQLPRLDDDHLKSLLPQLAIGCRSLADLRAAGWLHAMKELFTWQQLQTIDREAPERIEVPSGNHITLQYEPGRPPILAVRIQEVFGLLQTPRIAGGRVSVLLHLLAPNMRVTQVTDDLASFWANTYAMVRKDLRARYPKHSWPEDPYTALPQSRPRRK